MMMPRQVRLLAKGELGVAKPHPNRFGLRREAKRHAALEAVSAAEKRCRRCALPPQSKIFPAREDSGRSQDKERREEMAVAEFSLCFFAFFCGNPILK